MSTVCKFLLYIVINSVLVISSVYNDSVTNADKVFKLYSNSRDSIQHTSSDGIITLLRMQGDGNLVLSYNSNPIWSTKTNAAQSKPGNYTQLNLDGNLQVIGQNQTDHVWQSETSGHNNGHPHILVVADQCAYIMDRDRNIFWTSSGNSNCTLYDLDLEIKQATETRPDSTTFLTPIYGNVDKEINGAHLNQGRINAIDDWGIALGWSDGSYNNTLFIRNWYADQESSYDKRLGSAPAAQNPVACDPFVLNDNDYIIGYHIYDSSEGFVHGIIFYTSLGCKYECFGNADKEPYNIIDHSIVSYYYGVNDFWYLSGFNAYGGDIIDMLQMQFTQLPTGSNLSTSDKLMCDMSSSPTLHPTERTLTPITDPTTNPTIDSTNNPTLHPTSQPTTNPTLDPTVTSSISITVRTNDTSISSTSIASIANPSNDPTNNPISITQQGTHSPVSGITELTSMTESDTLRPRIFTGDNTINPVLIWVMIGVLCVCILILITKYLYGRSQRMQQQDAERMAVNEVMQSAHNEEMVNSMNMAQLSVVQCNESHITSDAKPVPHSDILRWLTDVVKLEQYYDCFIENGYDDMEFVKDIETKDELQSIGIKLQGHQTRIFAQIMALRGLKIKKHHSNDGVMDAEGANPHIEGPNEHITPSYSEHSVDSVVKTTQFETDGQTKGNFKVVGEDPDVDLIDIQK